MDGRMKGLIDSDGLERRETRRARSAACANSHRENKTRIIVVVVVVVSQSASQPVSQSASQPVSQSASRSVSQSVSQSSRWDKLGTTKKRSSQPASQPAGLEECSDEATNGVRGKYSQGSGRPSGTVGAVAMVQKSAGSGKREVVEGFWQLLDGACQAEEV
ncbi:hypothetical protein F5B17DRAFT_434987 [Nemania serpens]|nr:hypothetical protein F5B17DRAFT_434987 [Nemania serpens]